MGTKMLRADAEEVLRSLQMVGEGWYIQVGQWIKAGAHTALDMDEREFAASIGQRLRDPSDAIVEMFDQGHSQKRIARVLGVDHSTTVHNTLVRAGRIEGEIVTKSNRRALDAGTGSAAPDSGAGTGSAAPDSDAVAQANEEARKAKAEADKAKDQLDKYKAKHKEMAKQVAAQVEAARREAEGKITEQERERIRKEAEAWAHEQGEKILSGTRKMAVAHVVSAIHEAAEDLATLLEDGGISGEDMDKISAALAALNEQVTVARASVTTTVKEDR